MHSSYVKCSWKPESSSWTTVCSGGTVHAMCGHKLGVGAPTHPQACGADSWLYNTLEFPWNSLVRSHGCPGLENTYVSFSGGSCLARRVAPSPVAAHLQRAPLPLPGPLSRAQDWASGRWLWDPLRKAASCQPKHQSLRMRTRLGRHTLHVCLTSLDWELKLKDHPFLIQFVKTASETRVRQSEVRACFGFSTIRRDWLVNAVYLGFCLIYILKEIT